MIDTQELVARTDVKSVVWHDLALDTLASMRNHCAELGSHYGQASLQYTEAIASLAHVLVSIASKGFARTAYVTKDGDKSLFVNEGDVFVYGIIWHGHRRHCINAGCKAQINDDGKVWTYSPQDKADSLCQGPHAPSYGLNAPQPGTWSMHS